MIEDIDVLIVGAGPVGLTLALDLGQRGVRTLLAELKPGPLRLPKMERTNPRSMEIFRRLGVHDQIRSQGLPADRAMDVFLVDSLNRPPLARLEYPSVDEARARIASRNDGSQPREPYQLISQYTLEPILIERLKVFPKIDARFGTELVSFVQGPDHVMAEMRDVADGRTYRVRARYLVGADGAGSGVRRAEAIKMEGRTDLGTVTNVFFRCDDLLDKSEVPQGRHYAFAGVAANGGSAGSLVVQDDLRHFAYHISAPPEADIVGMLRDVTGLDIEPEILHVGTWTQNMLVSTDHSAGRVFLVGDANHIYIPAGGLGMNTGVVDAINLGWKLAAVIEGWGGPGLLDSYAQERGATARRTLEFVAHAVEGAILSREGFTPEALDDTSTGRAALAGYLDHAVPMMRRIYEMHGADLGYRYSSGIVAEEAGLPPIDDAYCYEPSTYPGCHLPHFWLEPGSALYDRLGLGFTLLKLGGDVETGAFEDVFDDIGAPFEVLDIRNPELRELMAFDLIIVRPDLHIAWRGNCQPEDAPSLIARITGRSPSSSTRKVAASAKDLQQ